MDHEIKADFKVEAAAATEPAPPQAGVAIVIDRDAIAREVAKAIREVPPHGDQAYLEACKLVAGIFAMEAATRSQVEQAMDNHQARQLAAQDVQLYGAGFTKVQRNEDGTITQTHVPADEVFPDIGGAAVQDLVPPLEAPGDIGGGHFGYIDTKQEGNGAELQTAQHPIGEGEALEDLNPASLETVDAPPALAAAIDEHQAANDAAAERLALENAAHDAERLEADERARQEAAIAAQIAEASALDKPTTGKGSRKAKISRLDGQDAGAVVSPLDLPEPAPAPKIEE